MDLSAVFSLAAVKDGSGQGSTRSQHYRNPKSDIAVVAGFRGSGFAGCRDFNRCFCISADSAFLMLGACFCGSRFLIRYPLKSVGGFVQLLAALAGVPMVRFIGMPACSVGGMLRQLRNNRIFKGNFFCTGFIAEILITAVAVPVFDVALGHMGGGFGFRFHKVCVVGGVEFPVFFAADVADRFFCAGRRAAVMLTFISAFSAYAVFPFVRFFCYDNRIAAAVFAGMGSRCLCPYDFAGMIIGIDRSIGAPADIADCFFRAGRRAAGVGGSVDFCTAGAELPMLICIVLPVALCCTGVRTDDNRGDLRGKDGSVCLYTDLISAVCKP